MRVRDIMTKEVASCNPGTNAAAAAEIMWNRNCGALPIVEDGGKVVGIITDRDLFIALGTRNQNASDVPVGEVMDGDLALCTPEDDIRGALTTMAQRQLHRLPVVDNDGSLKGILSIDDIVLQADSNEIKDDLLNTLKAICNGQKQLALARRAGA